MEKGDGRGEGRERVEEMGERRDEIGDDRNIIKRFLSLK